MSQLTPIDLSFLLLERNARPMTMGLVQIFTPPRGERGADFADRVYQAFCATPPSGKFAQKVRFARLRSPDWQPIEPVMSQHVQRLTLSAPGTDRQLLELAGRLHRSLIDRTRPLWECYVIDGLEHGEIAVFGRVHHSMFDGISGIRAMFGTLNATAAETAIQPVWTELPPPPPRAGRSPRRKPGLADQARGLAESLLPLARQAIQLAGDVTGVTRSNRGWPLFSAARTALPKTPYDSMGRSYGSAYLAVDDVKAVAKAAGATVNDVAMAVSDIALRAYLARSGDAAPLPLIASVPVSTRGDDDTDASNAATLAQTKLGDADLAPLDRLRQISERMNELKRAMRSMPSPAQQVYAMATFGFAQLGDLPLLNTVLPLASHVLISNIPPQGAGPLFMGGGRLMRMHGLPILPPGHLINVTLAPYDGVLCFGVVASDAVIPDGWEFALELERAFAALRDEVLGAPAAPRKRKARVVKRPATTATAARTNRGKQATPAETVGRPRRRKQTKKAAG